MIKTSVIIPVYNTAEYLEECIDSVLAQTQKEIEIFLIDDGSTDGSLEIIDRYVSQYPFIYKLTQEHEYQGTARNRGLELARGKYVYFMDSDDAILPELFETCYELCERMDLDFAIFDAYGFRYDESDVELKVPDDIFDRTVLNIKDKIYSGPEFWNSVYNSHGILYLCWLHYIRRDYLLKNSLFYEERTYFEDNDWTLRMYLNAERLYYIPKQLHRHRWRRNSNMLGGFTPELLKGCFRMHWVLLRIYENCTDSDKKKMIRDVLRLNICRFDRLAEVGPLTAYTEPLREFCMGVIEGISKCRLEDPKLYIHYAALERILIGIKSWGDHLLYGTIVSGLKNSFKAAFPMLFRKVTIAIYGTGEVSRIILEVIGRYCDDRTCDLVFVHTTEATGGVFCGLSVYNVKDASDLKIDTIVIGSYLFKDSILEQIQLQLGTDIPVVCVQREMRFVQDNRKDLDMPSIVKNKIRPSSRSWQKRNKYYVLGTTYASRWLFSAYPDLLAKTEAFVDVSASPDGFLGLPVISPADIPEGAEVFAVNVKNSNAMKNTKPGSGLLLEYLSLWEPVRFTPCIVGIDASTNCQLNCTGCYMRLNHYGRVGKGDLSFEDYKRFLEENSSINTVELSNSGEPLLNPELPEILEHSRQRGVKVQFTNGVNLNYLSDKLAEDIVRCGVTYLRVSIDGTTEETYKKYRRNGSLSKVLENIRKINRIKKEMGSDTPKLYWQFILMEHNQHEAEYAVKMAAELGMSITFKTDWMGGFVPDDPEKLSAVTGIDFFSGKENDNEEKQTYRTDHFCRQMMLSPIINWDGRVLGCCTVFMSDWGINVFRRPLSELMNDVDYRAAAISLLSGKERFDHDGPCRTCHMYKDSVREKGLALLI